MTVTPASVTRSIMRRFSSVSKYRRTLGLDHIHALAINRVDAANWPRRRSISREPIRLVRAFHDALLTEGPLPLALLDQRMDAWMAEQKAR